MKTLRNLWDFAYGIILIAGFPLDILQQRHLILIFYRNLIKINFD